MPDRIPLLLYGATGRMGRAVREHLHEFPEVQLCACVAPREPTTAPAPGPIWLTPETLGTRRRREGFPENTVVLDFSLAAGTAQLVKILATWPHPLVSATTGLDAGTEATIEALSQRVAVLRASNLSFGNAMVERMLRSIPPGARSLLGADIVEHHHAGKKDAPSGTALALGKILGEPVTIHSIRAGTVPGTHRVILSAMGEMIEVTHTVIDRAVFARGALRAVQFLEGRPPGRYTTDHLLQES